MADKDLWASTTKNSLEFMERDLELALTMVTIASQAGKDSDKRARNIKNARRAFDTVQQLKEKVHASKEEWRPIQEKFKQLRDRLRDLGEHV
jgi:hypothetical protein